MKFLHLSDLHLKDNDLSPETFNCKIIIDKISEYYPEHYVIISGDITDDGSKSQYNQALTLLSGLNTGKVFICPGNHDYGPVGNFYLDSAAKSFDTKLSRKLIHNGDFITKKPVVTLIEDQVLLIALNSNLETSSPLDFARGEIGEKQLTDLETIINDTQNKGKTKIVFCHHHPINYTNPFMELNDAEHFLKIIQSNIDVLLFGHRHLPKIWYNYLGIQVVNSCNKSTEIKMSNNKLWCYEFEIDHEKVKTKVIAFN